jgi:hypothetical protein
MLSLMGGCLYLFAGCAKDTLQRQAVSGLVQFKGKPLDTGRIEFSPLDGQATLVAADVKKGRFAIPAKQGLSPGEYKVMLNAPLFAATTAPAGAPGSDLGPPPKERIPETYNAKSELRASVKKGEKNNFTFDLK